MKTLKMTFFIGQSFPIALNKGRIYFLTKIMLLNEIQACFLSLCFFALTFFKSNSITFRFSLSLTDVTTIIRRSNSFGSVYNIKKNEN